MSIKQMDKEYAEYLKNKNGASQKKSSKEIDKKLKEKRIINAKKFKETFENLESFKNKIELFNANSHGIKNNEDTTNRYINMENVINAYTGDENAISQLDELLDNESAERMSLIIRRYLEEEIDIDMTESLLFVELHGIDTSKLPNKEYNDEELVNLSIIKEMCPSIDVSEFVGCSSGQLSIIAKAACQGANLTNLNLLSEFCILGSIEQTRENKELNYIPIKIDKNLHEKFIIYEYNEVTKDIDIFEEAVKKERKLAEVDENNNFKTGSLENVKNVLIQSEIIQTLNEINTDSLTKEIEHYRQETRHEAILNPMSQEEKTRIKNEEEQALAEHNAIINGASAFLNSVS